MTLVLLGAACGEPPAGASHGALQLELVSGDAQVGTCYADLADPVVVRVARDNSPYGVSGQRVDFEVLEGGGWMSRDWWETDGLGIATGRWTLGVGPQVLEARAAEPDGTGEVFVRFTAIAQLPEGVERWIPPDPDGEYQFNPDVSGDRVVWSERRNGNVDIYLYDLATETERRITTDPKVQHHPRIDGERIVWRDLRNDVGDGADIYLYDLATGAERRITTGAERRITTGLNPRGYPDISGDHIVWSESWGIPGAFWYSNIYLYDLATETKRQITASAPPLRPSTVRRGRPRIDGTRIVWRETGHGNSGIYLYDLATDTERRITTRPPGHPAIAGHRIVWQERRNGNDDIYLYDLVTETERQVTTRQMASPVSWRDAPAIDGTRIAWEEWDGPSDIYLYDLATETERRMTTDSWSQRPAIAGNHIVWQDYSVRVYDLPFCTPP